MNETTRHDRRSPLAEATLRSDETLDMPIGPIELRRSHFDDGACARLFDEMDYQRASQAYLWTTPLVSNTAWRDAQASSFGVTHETDFVVHDSLKEKSEATFRDREGNETFP